MDTAIIAPRHTEGAGVPFDELAGQLHFPLPDMPSLVLGVDPGASGGWAVIEPRSRCLVAAGRMPTLTLGKRTIIDLRQLDQCLAHLPPIDRAVVELVGAMPKQGRTSIFTFGRYAGAIESYVALRVGRLEYITPAQWKSRAKIPSGSPKRASLDTASLTFGLGPVDWRVLANDGIAEAALLALHSEAGA